MENKLPEGWKLVELKDYAYFQEGPGIRKWQFMDQGIKLLNVRNLVNGELYLDNTERHVSEEEVFEKYEHFLLNPDEIVMASSGVTWGKTALVRSEHLPLMLNTSTIRFRSLDCQVLDQSYLLLFLNSELFTKQIERLITGSAQPNFGPSHLMLVKLLLPPLETQQKIVSILEKAEETKKLRIQADEFTQELLQGVFLEMFGDLEINPKGWVVKGFDYFAKIDTKMTKDFTIFENKPHIGIENIEKDTGNLINYKEVGTQNLTSGKYIFTENHIIYSKIRPNLNKVALPDFDGLCSADAYPLLVNKNHTNRHFFAHILRSKYFLDNMLKLSDRTNIPKVNKDQLRSFECICPPIELQNKFAEIAEQVGKTKQSQQQSSLEINTLFDALMQKAFMGELVT